VEGFTPLTYVPDTAQMKVRLPAVLKVTCVSHACTQGMAIRGTSTGYSSDCHTTGPVNCLQGHQQLHDCPHLLIGTLRCDLIIQT
jgi:hypothetical protein